ncbi:hypothetical protein O181_007556 [Austropuccinia psidii MF-1]|uniref:Uncharacterized protein n=1 Tax=Austropuccinia psidii MF-1 TaxID=1389203 RepID=A0A9Q3BN26_9BASI|nr:hypothetical protein [Austropuccinia psidii MF-1]
MLLLCIPIRDIQRSTNVRGSISTGERPIYSSSEVPICRINNQGIVKRIRRIANLPTDPDGEEVQVLYHKINQLCNSSPSHQASGTFQSQITPSTPRNFHPRLAAVLSSFHQSSPHPSTARPPALGSPMR